MQYDKINHEGINNTQITMIVTISGKVLIVITENSIEFITAVSQYEKQWGHTSILVKKQL